MHDVLKRKPRKAHRKLWLAAALTALLLITGAWLYLEHQPEEPLPENIITRETLYQHDPAQVQSIAATIEGEDDWAVAAQDGLLVLQGEDGYTLSEDISADLMDAAATITVDEVLADNWHDYADHLSDFGLETPALIADITYTDGTAIRLRVGDVGHTGTWRYMLIDGDDRLYAFSNSMVDALFVSREALWDITQPVLHKARFDRITLRLGDGSIHAQWTLEGDITNTDSTERWWLTEPFIYPADSEAMTGLLGNAATLRLGAYVGPATPENLALYGLDTPRMTIELHMAAGTIGDINADGAFTPVDYPESTVTFTIGGERSDLADYVLYEDCVYVSSHYTMGVFLDVNARSTLNRYPVLTALGNLARLVIDEDGTTTVYAITRTEQVAENNELVYDEEGNLLYDYTLTRNGEAFDYAVFEAAYSQLVMVTVSGALPADEEIAAAPHTVYTFTDIDGTVHTVALADFDGMHDAVIVDGHAVFYLIKGGFKLNLE
ncbi:MAG: DUF4340 domain-containing protein [Clostridia bacterium]|nr:DUF4340 domain-containing protein [Clostridia bacterium]